MWLVLATEVLLFAGLFCAYAVYRGSHPNLHLRAPLPGQEPRCPEHRHPAVQLPDHGVGRAGRATRPAQAVGGPARPDALGGCGFLSVKYVEYSHKIRDGLLWGTKYAPTHGAHGATAPGHEAAGQAAHQAPAPVVDPHAARGPGGGGGHRPGAIRARRSAGAPDVRSRSGGAVAGRGPRSAREPFGRAVAHQDRPGRPRGSRPARDDQGQPDSRPAAAPKNVHIFFGSTTS